MTLADKQPVADQETGSTGAVPPSAGSAISPEQAQARLDALAVLGSALDTFRSREGRAPTGSELRKEMTHLTRGGFKVKALGYRRFRDLVAEAEVRGLVSVDAERQGDIAVNPPGHATPSPGAPFLRADLWKAIVDWDPGMTRVWDTESRRAILFPTEPVLLEPEKFQRIRSDLANSPDRYLHIPHLTINDQLELLRSFAASLNLDPVTSAAVARGFETRRPIKTVLDILKDYDSDAAINWNAVLRTQAHNYAQQWKASNPELADVSLTARSAEKDDRRNLRDDDGRSEEKAAEIERPTESRQSPVDHLLADESAIRFLIHRAVDRMPLHELHALRIPLGYLLKEG